MMKPKERYYSYALLQANCDRNTSAALLKDDSPMDLSTKKHSPIVHSAYTSNDFDAHSIASSLSYNEWSSKYLIANASARNLQSPSSLLPYLLLNRSCYDVPSSIGDSIIDLKNSKNGVICDSYGNQYGAIHGQPLISRSSPVIDLCKSSVYERAARNGSLSQKSSANNSSSSSSSPSSLTHHSANDYNETRRLLERSPTNSSFSSTSDHLRYSRSHNGSFNRRRLLLRRSKSFPLLPQVTDKNKYSGYCFQRMAKSKSETDLTKIFNKKVFVSINTQSAYSNRNGNIRIESPPKNSKHETSLIRENMDYKNNGNHDYSDHEREDEDAVESGVSDDYGSDDALDLRVTNSTPSYRSGYADGNPDAERLFHHINALLLNQAHSPHKEDLSPPAPSPLDLYRQYYYYLMHQPAFASRAAAAVAVAETYAKLISAASNHNQSSVDYSVENNNSKYEHESSSPDFIINGTRAELRSADTTNNGIVFDRKRISRPLTGKHVRHGTGASPTTLLTLRNMIQERQRLREIGAVPMGKYGKGKGGKRVKRK